MCHAIKFVHDIVSELKDKDGEVFVTITSEVPPGDVQRETPFATLHPVGRPTLQASVRSRELKLCAERDTNLPF